jgi:hypothetical protein
VPVVLSSGDLLSDRYRLDERVATGGMGDVWRATDTVLGRTVAVKVLLPALRSEPGFDARFRAEAQILATLRHPAVVDVYDYGESELDGGTVAYLVMAYVDGEPLSGRIAAAGILGVEETLSVVAQAADALQAAHDNGVVHRDVKPGNLLVRPDGSVVLVDFGVARSGVAAVTSAHAVPGTALYMAPEQASGRGVSAATDVYALGAVAYHCLTGHPPFTGDTALEIAVRQVQDDPPPLPEDLPAAVRTLVDQTLAKLPEERPSSAAAFAAQARAVLAGLPVAGVRAGAPADEAATTQLVEVAARPVGRRRTIGVGLVTAVILGLATVLAVLGMTRPSGAPVRDEPARSPAPAAPVAPATESSRVVVRVEDPPGSPQRGRSPSPPAGTRPAPSRPPETSTPPPTSRAPAPEPTQQPSSPAPTTTSAPIGTGSP